MRILPPTRRTQQSGFTLLEMLISLALILVLSGSILGGMGDMQKTYRHNEIRSVLNGQMRAVLEMMAQEVGQAGLPASGMAGNTIYTGSGAAGAAATVTQAVTTTGSQTVTVVAGATVQTNQVVIADAGNSAEAITILNTTANSSNQIIQITAVFQKTHASGFMLYPHGVYPGGIAFQTTPTQLNGAYSNTSLIAVGDINGTGNLSIVEYSCPVTNPALTGGTLPTTGNLATVKDSNNVQWGPLIRTEYVYTDSAGGGSFSVNGATATMLALVRVATTTSPTPSDGCRFDYNIVTPASCPSWWMVNSVDVTLVGESQTNDVQTNSPVVNAPVTITKSFMNIQPRNILNAWNLYNYNNSLNPGSANNCSDLLSLPTAVTTQIGQFTQ
jgi:prepilin-type N-terminal cleavage/methylation domain-containing protein